MFQVWLVTGASRGLGQQVVEAALAAGHQVVATSRSGEFIRTTRDHQDRLLVLPLDVTASDPLVFEAVVQAAVDRFGRIDVLVNNAGYGQLTVFEETSEAQMRAVFETNVFGLMKVTRAVLPVMRRHNAGHIFNISSAAGYADQGFSPYNATKFAVTGFSGALAFELSSTNIRVTNVGPGPFRTDFLDPTSLGSQPDQMIGDYDEVRQWLGRYVGSNNHSQGGDPSRLAKLLLEVAQSESPPLHLLVGASAMALAQAYQDRLEQDIRAWQEPSSATAYQET